MQTRIPIPQLNLTPRVRTQTSVATLTPNLDNYEVEKLTAQAENLTIANPTGPIGKSGKIIVTATGSTRTVDFGTDYNLLPETPEEVAAGETVVYIWDRVETSGTGSVDISGIER
jgi:polyisoprenoid-binding protein YceI